MEGLVGFYLQSKYLLLIAFYYVISRGDRIAQLQSSCKVEI